MKKTLLALAALTAFAGAASAQSSVTVFGIVDLSVNQINNSSAGTVSVLSSDGLNSNRLGFRGIEDLGGGLRAGFWIEGGMANDTGTGGGRAVGVVGLLWGTGLSAGSVGERDPHRGRRLGGAGPAAPADRAFRLGPS